MYKINQPPVSIIIPSFNQGKFIEETIVSILNQSYKNLEIIIIDGGSSDNTIDIIKKYNDRIKYWVSEKDKGQSDAINKGFKLATGKYINWLNSDDILLEGAIQTMVDFLETNLNVDLVYGNVIMIDEIGNKIIERREINYDYNIILYGINYIPQPSALFRKKVVEKAGYLDINMHYCMDHEYWIRFHSIGLKFAYINDFFAGYRVHNNAKGFSGKTKEIYRERLELKRKYGLKIHNKTIECVVYFILFLLYRILRKIRQFYLHKNSNFIPFSLKIKINEKLK